MCRADGLALDDRLLSPPEPTQRISRPRHCPHRGFRASLPPLRFGLAKSPVPIDLPRSGTRPHATVRCDVAPLLLLAALAHARCRPSDRDCVGRRRHRADLPGRRAASARSERLRTPAASATTCSISSRRACRRPAIARRRRPTSSRARSRRPTDARTSSKAMSNWQARCAAASRFPDLRHRDDRLHRQRQRALIRTTRTLMSADHAHGTGHAEHDLPRQRALPDARPARQRHRGDGQPDRSGSFEDAFTAPIRPAIRTSASGRSAQRDGHGSRRKRRPRPRRDHVSTTACRSSGFRT